MLVRHSFDERFILKMNELRDTYGEDMLKINGIGSDYLDINKFAKKFFKTDVVSDVSADGNGNVEDSSVLSFEYEFTKSILKLNSFYILWKKMVENEKYGIKRANKILELSINGSLKIHDLHFFLKPYCYAFSVEPMVTKGLPFIKKIKIGPPKHFTSFINLVVQLTAFCSNQIAGAVAFPDFFVYMDWYARKDYGERYLETHAKEIEQDLQSFVFSCNYPFRGSQSAFVNVSTYDDYFLKDLFSSVYYPDGSTPNFDSIKKLQEFYMRFFVNESKTQTFTFPVNTVTFYKDDAGVIKDEAFLNLVSELNSYNGVFNIYTGPLGSLSSCCRLRSDTSKIKEYTNSFGAGGVQIGSHRVVTLNLPRIAYQSEDQAQFMKILDYNTRAAQDILDVHRHIITENIQNHKLPLYDHQFMFLQKQFSTVGFIGMNEAVDILQMDITESHGQEFAKSILDKINTLNNQRSKEDGNIRNVEQIPGESAAVELAKADKLLFSGHKYKMYGNQFVPLWVNTDIHKRIQTHGKFDSECQGGGILHINSYDSLTADQMKKLIMYSAKQGVIYSGINIAQCRCNTCGKLFIGKFDKSPCHNANTTHYLRVVGFLTPVTNWIPMRREEYKVRQFYTTPQLAEAQTV